MESLTEQFLDTIQARLLGLDRQLPAIAAAATRVAERACAGARVWVLSDETGFVSELQHRAAGLMMLRGMPGGEEEPPLDDAIDAGDAVIAATQEHDPERQGRLLDALVERGVHVTLVGSAESSLRGKADAFVDNGLQPGTAPVLSHRGAGICPAASTINVAAGWLWVLELANACHRLGQAPVFLVSGGLAAGFDRNQQHEGKAFHDPGEYHVLPSPAGQKGRELVAELLRCFSGIRATEMGKLAEVGAVAAATIAAGRSVWCASIGHNLAAQRDIDGTPGFFRLQFPEQGESADVEAGDYYIFNGYYNFPKEELELARASGVRSAWILGGREIESIYPHAGEIHIDAYWRYGDTSVYLPGYDIRVIPPSGVIATAMLWILHAAAAQEMSA
jgi:hypothetical protein